MDNVTDLPIVQRNPGLEGDFLNLLTKVRALQPGYPLFHASVIRGALEKAIPESDGMIVDVSEIKTIGDCRYAITTRDHAGQTYRITVQVEP